MLTAPGREDAAGARGGPEGALDRLLSRRPSTRIRWGLERTERMLRALGDPHRASPAVHIGGTNGKGSVAATVASLLRRTGRRVGLYTSPHLIDFAERVQVDGEPLGGPALEAAAAEVLPLAEAEDATFFEAVTVLAFLALARARVDIVVAEVGLGGRLDATNVLSPEVAVVTNIAWDHAEYLGKTLVAIAGEKAGILKPATPAVVGPLPERLLEVFRDRARGLDAPLAVLGGEAAVESVRVSLAGTRFVYRSPDRPEGLEARTPLVGSFQAGNAGLALMALERLGRLPPDGALRAGLSEVRWPGRFQVVRRPEGLWIFDVAHNTAGSTALAEALRQTRPDPPVVLLTAILGDKPWREMLDPLLSAGVGGVFTVAPSSPPERRWDPGAARTAISGHRVRVEPRFGRALEAARELAGEGTVVVTGSCHTVGDALRSLGIDPWEPPAGERVSPPSREIPT